MEEKLAVLTQYCWVTEKSCWEKGSPEKGHQGAGCQGQLVLRQRIASSHLRACGPSPWLAAHGKQWCALGRPFQGGQLGKQTHRPWLRQVGAKQHPWCLRYKRWWPSSRESSSCSLELLERFSKQTWRELHHYNRIMIKRKPMVFLWNA